VFPGYPHQSPQRPLVHQALLHLRAPGPPGEPGASEGRHLRRPIRQSTAQRSQCNSLSQRVGGGAGNRSRPTDPESSEKTEEAIGNGSPETPSFSADFLQVPAGHDARHELDEQFHGARHEREETRHDAEHARELAEAFLQTAAAGEPSHALAIALAASVAARADVRLALAVLAGGPTIDACATELAELVLSDGADSSAEGKGRTA